MDTERDDVTPFGDGDEPGEPVILLGKGDATRVLRPEQHQARRSSFRKGLAGGLAAGLAVGAAAAFLLVTQVFPSQGAPAAAPVPSPAVAVSTADADRLRQRVAELEGAEARLAEATAEIGRLKARAGELEARNARLAETVRSVRSVFEAVDVKGKRDTVFGKDGAKPEKE